MPGRRYIYTPAAANQAPKVTFSELAHWAPIPTEARWRLHDWLTPVIRSDGRQGARCR
jgi:hypothetical protein